MIRPTAPGRQGIGAPADPAGAPQTRLLGVKIANDYSSEARVFAGLLAHRGDGYSALVLHHDAPDEPQAAQLFAADAGVPLARFDTGFRGRTDDRRPLPARLLARLRFLATLPAMTRTARAFRPHVVYSSQQRWDCYAASHIARRLRRPQIIHLHYIIGPWLGGHVLRRLLSCDHVVAVSDFIRDEALRHGVPPERVTTIRNTILPPPPPPSGTGAAVREELGLPGDVPLLGMVARFDPFKGQGDVLAAFTRVLARHPDARLVFVGDGPDRASLAAEAARSAGGRVVFTGARADVARLLATLDVFVHPSRADPCPVAVLEAAAAGLPVVAYADGGIPEIVADGETGLLAPTGDVSALAGALTRLLDAPELRQRLGAAARRRVAETFRPAAAGQTFADLVRRVAEPAPRPAPSPGGPVSQRRAPPGSGRTPELRGPV